MARAAAGGAAARDVRRRGRPGAPSATPCCSASGSASAGVDDLGLDEPARVVVVDVVGESVLVTSDEDGGLHAAYNVCRHRGSQLAPVAEPPSPCLCGVGAALSLPLVDLRPRRPAAAGAARRRVDEPERRSRCTRSASRPGAASSSCTSRRSRRTPLADAVAQRRARRWPTTGSPAWSPGATLTYDVAANYKVLLENYNECYHCGPVHPELSPAGAVVRRRRRRPRLGRGHPAPRGRLDLHHDRDHDRAPLPGPDEAGADPAQGRPRLPEPDAVRLGRPRRGVRAACREAVDRTDVVCSLLFAADEAAQPTLRPERRRRAVGPGQPAGLGDLRVGAARHVVARLPRTAGSRRWRTTASTSAAGCCPGWRRRRMTDVSSGRLRRRRARRARQRHGLELARRGHRVVGLERFELGHARGASHDTSRILRHSYHTPAYVRLTQEAYADWAGLERDAGDAAWSPRSAGSTCSRRTRRSARSTTSQSLDEVGHRLRRARRRAEVMQRWPQFRLPPGTLGAAPGRRRDRAGRPRHRGACRTRPGGTVPTCATAQPGARAARPRRRGVEVTTPDGEMHCRGLVVCADAWINDVLGGLGHADPARGDPRAGDLLRAAGPADVRSRPAAAVDLDGRPVVLRLPDLRRADRQGGAGLRRPGRRPRDGRDDASPTRRWRRGSPRTCARMLPGQRGAGAVAALPVHADPRPRLRDGSPSRATRASWSGSAPRTGSSSRRPSAGCSPTWWSTGATTTDLSAFRLDRPALTDPDYQAHWLV